MPADGGRIGPVARVPMYEVVARRLRRAIHLGDFLPGDAFPPERELAETLGVSRVTLREAIRILEAEGYVKSKRGRNAGLVLLPQSESVDVLRARLLERHEELEALFDFRLATEAAAASLAAARRTDRDLGAAEAAIEDLKRSRDMSTFRRADAAFHLAVADAARNMWLRDAIEDARAAMFLPLDVFDPSLPLTTSIRQHRRILAAIRKGDSRAAERAMIIHIQNTRRDLDDALTVTEKAE